MNKTSVKFLCPTCSASLPFSELIVDPLMQEIIEESKKRNGDGGDEIDEVIISGDGTWTLENHEKHKAESEGASSLRFHHRHTEVKKSREVLTIEDNRSKSVNVNSEVIVID